MVETSPPIKINLCSIISPPHPAVQKLSRVGGFALIGILDESISENVNKSSLNTPFKKPAKYNRKQNATLSMPIESGLYSPNHLSNLHLHCQNSPSRV